MKKLFKIIAVLLGVYALSFVAFRLIYPLPDTNRDEATLHLPPSWDSPLGQSILKGTEANAGKTGIVPLFEGNAAFAARALLIRSAQSSIDAQYYIWQGDTTGMMLLDELRAAADRGVRVRLLVDDNGIHGLDREMAALDAMPTAEVRIFNPFTLRKPKFASLLFDFPRLNRRMHNKSITVDGIVTIVGGRNIGDIYFDYGEGVHYVDVDAIAVGEIVPEVEDEFDTFWNSEPVYAAQFVLKQGPVSTTIISDPAAAMRDTIKGAGYEKAIVETNLMQQIKDQASLFEWTDVELFVDTPAKGLGEASDDELLIASLIDVFDQSETSLDLVSAYFVPGDAGTEALTQIAGNDVSIRILTNSMEATDVSPVHGAYMRYRPELLDQDIELFELRALEDKHRELSLSALLAGSASSLHAKVASIDGKQAFIGSFNLDPRSARLNTEMGLLINSPQIAEWISGYLDHPVFAYQVVQGNDDALQWRELSTDGSVKEYDEEPNVGALRRNFVTFTGWLPIEGML